MIGTLIGMGTKMLSGVASGIAGAAAAAKEKRITAQQLNQNNEWYNQEMSKDYTQRAESQNAINDMREAFLERQRTAAATNAVAGGTAESEALLKEQSAKAMADTMGDIAVASESQKEAAAKEYRDRNTDLQNKMAQAEADRKNNIAKAAASVLDAGTGIATGALDSYNKVSTPLPSNPREQGINTVNTMFGNIGKSAKDVAQSLGTPVSVDMDKYQPSIIEENIEPDVFGLKKK